MTTEEMTVYRAFVQSAADGAAASKKPSEILLNRTAPHATIVLEVLFQHAQKVVQILTGRLNADVYGTDSVVAAACGFLRREGARLEIATEQTIPADHKLLNAFREAGLLENVVIRLVPSTLEQNYSYHFAVADSANYRLEREKKTFEAMVQFGDEELGQTLTRVFTGIFQQSAIVALT